MQQGPSILEQREKESQAKYRQIADILRERILRGRYKPGETIPSYPRLRELFEVSDITVRKAVALLVNEKLLRMERGRGKGFFVMPPVPARGSGRRLHRLFAHHGVDCRVLGIPKTVDNDLLGTDHSLGYPSAAKHVMNTVKEAVIDASCYPHGKLVLLEIMGRNAGWLTAASDLLPYPYRPDLFFLPENPFDEERFLKVISDTYWKKGYAVAALSEGVQLPRPKKKVDAFGHSSLEGVAVTLANLIEEKTKIPTRTMELSLPQRADPINVARIDREEAIELSRYAVREILKGESGKMVCIRRLSNEPYKVEYFTSDVHVVANGERKVPREMLVDETRMADSFRKYLAPLVKGEVEVAYEDGTFKAARFSYVKAE